MVKPWDETVAEKITVPANALTLVTVTVEFPRAPTPTTREAGLEDKVKSGANPTVTETVTE